MGVAQGSDVDFGGVARILGLPDATAPQHPFTLAQFQRSARYSIAAVEFDLPNSSDWALNSPALIQPDSAATGLSIAQFRKAAEDGVGILERWIPAGATDVTLQGLHRGETSPGGSPLNVQISVYCRSILPGGGVTAWSSVYDLTPWVMPASVTTWVDSSQTVPLATLGLVAGRVNQIELVRRSFQGSDSYLGLWNLAHAVVGFA